MTGIDGDTIILGVVERTYGVIIATLRKHAGD